MWPVGWGTSSAIHNHAGKYAQAETDARKTFELEPSYPPAHWSLAWTYERERKYPEAIQEFQKALELSNHSPLAMAILGQAYAEAGQKHKAMKILNEILRLRTEKKYVSAYNVAALYAGLEQKQQALDWLNIAYKEDDPWLIQLTYDLRFDKIRADDRFQSLMRRMEFFKHGASQS